MEMEQQKPYNLGKTIKHVTKVKVVIRFAWNVDNPA